MTTAVTLGAAVILLAPQDEPVRFARDPALSPEGARLAFSWHGDLWIVEVDGGRARRLTRTPHDESAPAWSPDGTSLAFVSDEAGQKEIFVLEIGSGTLRRLTFHEADDRAPAWSPDGRWIAFDSNRDPKCDLPINARWFDVWRVPASGGTPERVTHFGGENPAWSPDGRWIAFDRYASGYGDGEHDIYLVDPSGGVPKRLVGGPQDARRPTFFGPDVVFAERPPGRTRWRLRCVALSGVDRVEPLPPTGPHDRWPTAAGKALAFLRGFDLMIFRDGILKRIETVAPAWDREEERTETLTAGLLWPGPGAGGGELIGVLKGDVWAVPLGGGSPRRLTVTVEEEWETRWVAGQGIFFVKGQAGGGAATLCLVEDGRIREVTTRREDFRSPRLSPNGRLIAYFVSAFGGLDMRVIDRDGRTVLERARKEVDESHPAFSPDGQRIAYLRFDPSNVRTEIVAVILDDGREEVLYEELGECSDLEWSPDGHRLAWCRQTDTGYSTARVLEIGSKLLRRIPRPAGVSMRRPAWMPDSRRLVVEERVVVRGVEDATGCGTAIVDVDVEGRVERVKFEAVRAYSVRDEMAAVFWEVWGHYQRGFYDPNFHGASWEKLGEEMLSLAGECRTSAELYELIGLLLEELRASHVQHRPPSGTSQIETWSLGLEGRLDKEGYRIERMVRGGPAEWAGLRVGDLLIAADRVSVLRRSLDEALSAPRGQPPPQPELSIFRGEEILTLRVRPLSMQELREARYRELIDRRKAILEEQSQGRLGYHHVQFMAESEVRRFETALREELAGREGLVLDIRDGVGGLAHWQLLTLVDATARQRFGSSAELMTRGRDGRTSPDLFRGNSIGGAIPAETLWCKPLVLVQNEVTRSDKEIFSYLIGRSGRAWRIGTVTAGGVIGGCPIRLRDGSSIVLPVQGWFAADGRNLEGMGVRPDYEAALAVEDLHEGRDPQLEKAVEVLMDQLEGRLGPPAAR